MSDDALRQSMRRDDPFETGLATANQISKLFRVNKNDIGRHLDGITPVDRRGVGGTARYDVREAASVLVKPSYEIEDKIRRMNQADLPPLLAKEFWNGQRAREAYEDTIGNRWATDDVLAVFAEAFGDVGMALKLLEDRVEREAAFTATQRAIIRRLVRGAVNGLRETLVTKYEGRPGPNDNVSGEMPAEETL